MPKKTKATAHNINTQQISKSASIRVAKKKVFIQPELRAYPPLRNVTFLTASGTSASATVY
ncbi:MAG: hypothetical protein ACP5MB_11040 [bacterium]